MRSLQVCPRSKCYKVTLAISSKVRNRSSAEQRQPKGGHMKDMQKLRTQIAECEIIRDLATDPKKRELFARLAEHFKVLAGEIEKSMADPP